MVADGYAEAAVEPVWPGLGSPLFHVGGKEEIPLFKVALRRLADQVSVEDWPTGTLAGSSDMLTTGAGGATLATTDALFATPSQVSV